MRLLLLLLLMSCLRTRPQYPFTFPISPNVELLFVLIFAAIARQTHVRICISWDEPITRTEVPVEAIRISALSVDLSSFEIGSICHFDSQNNGSTANRIIPNFVSMLPQMNGFGQCRNTTRSSMSARRRRKNRRKWRYTPSLVYATLKRSRD